MTPRRRRSSSTLFPLVTYKLLSLYIFGTNCAISDRLEGRGGRQGSAKEEVNSPLCRSSPFRYSSIIDHDCRRKRWMGSGRLLYYETGVPRDYSARWGVSDITSCFHHAFGLGPFAMYHICHNVCSHLRNDTTLNFQFL
jgi:hypothetical protein